MIEGVLQSHALDKGNSTRMLPDFWDLKTFCGKSDAFARYKNYKRQKYKYNEKISFPVSSLPHTSLLLPQRLTIFTEEGLRYSFKGFVFLFA